MRSRLKSTTLGLTSSVSYLFPGFIEPLLLRMFSKKLKKELLGELTDECLELLLRGMELSFCLSKGYRSNLNEFRGTYVLRTRNELVVNSITFDQNRMTVHENAIDHWDIRVTFKDVQTFWKFVFSRDHDILNLILANEVEMDGNLNYIYKFGFLARDLAHRLGF